MAGGKRRWWCGRGAHGTKLEPQEAQRMRMARKKPTFPGYLRCAESCSRPVHIPATVYNSAKQTFYRGGTLRSSDLLKVTQRVSLASNPRLLWWVRKSPEQAKTYSPGLALGVGHCAHIPPGRRTRGARLSKGLSLCKLGKVGRGGLGWILLCALTVPHPLRAEDKHGPGGHVNNTVNE